MSLMLLFCFLLPQSYTVEYEVVIRPIETKTVVADRAAEVLMTRQFFGESFKVIEAEENSKIKNDN